MKALIINCSPVRDGATAEIVRLADKRLRESYDVKAVCIDDYHIGYCKGCRVCHATAECVQMDDMNALMGELAQADVILCVSPSYWADVPGQFKSFIDRCTPWCDTHEPHASIGGGKIGYCIVLRTGSGMKECERLVQSIWHFYGHMGVMPRDSLALCGVAQKADVVAREGEIYAFCDRMTD